MDINDYKKYEPIDGKWYITKELGSGSFGTVLEIQRKDFPEMKSALKIISIPNSQSEVRSYKEENYDLDDKSITSYFYGFVEEFVKEFKLMSQLKGNSNIVSYEDHDIKKHDNGVGWDILIRMELLTPLGKYLADHASDKNTVVKLGIDMCKALEVCQKYNIIHRDIKPSNIFVSDNGDFKLGDFGVARTLEKTSSGLSKKGTYTYMAPEIFKGEAYGANVDTYSLGIVMYKLLNDNLEPFRTNRTFGDGEKAMELRMRGAKMVKPKNADDALAAVVLKACSYDPAERYQSPSEMRKQLEAILSAKGDEQSAGANKEEMVHEPPVIGNGAEILDNASRTSAEESGNANETVSVFLGTESEETMDEEHHTVSIFMDQKEDGSAVLNTEQEVVKAAFAHEPKDFKSSKGKAEVAKAMEKLVPLYSEKIPLSAMLGSLNMDDLKAKAQSTDTDSLLVMVKSMAFHMGEGDDKNVIGPVQKCLIEELQKRPLGRSEKHTASRKQQKGKRADDTAKKTPALSERIKGFLFKTWKIIVPAIALVLLLSLFVVIGGKGVDDIENLPEKIVLSFGDQFQLEPRPVSGNGRYSIEYSVSDESIATVDENGLITAKTVAGDTELTVRLKKFKAQISIEVTEKIDASALEEKYKEAKELLEIVNNDTLINQDNVADEKLGVQQTLDLLGSISIEDIAEQKLDVLADLPDISYVQSMIDGLNTAYEKAKELVITESKNTPNNTTSNNTSNSTSNNTSSSTGNRGAESTSGKVSTQKKCSVCGSTAHTNHPTCPVCGSTSHTSHPQETVSCPVCGSKYHSVHPSSDAPDITVDVFN